MAVPDFQSLMLPLVQAVGDGASHTTPELEAAVSDCLGLSEADRAQVLGSGKKRALYDRINWARYYLLRAGLVTFPSRGSTQITARGKKVLSSTLDRIDVAYLEHFAEFVEFKKRKSASEVGGETPATGQSLTGPTASLQTPEETLQGAYQEIMDALAQNLLVAVRSMTPARFEKLVVDLLVAMGYGGSAKDAGRAVGKGGDEGIDGIIKEDPLGLDVIYLQAKRWESVVGRPEIQKFAGALLGQHAQKGVFITTSRFSSDATDFAARLDAKVILIDGEQLAKLMIEHGVGVSTTERYEIKRVDSDYFAEDQG